MLCAARAHAALVSLRHRPGLHLCTLPRLQRLRAHVRRRLRSMQGRPPATAQRRGQQRAPGVWRAAHQEAGRQLQQGYRKLRRQRILSSSAARAASSYAQLEELPVLVEPQYVRPATATHLALC